jgi:hypothetical protein
MKIKIIIDDSIPEFEGKISKKTYDEIPERKRPLLYSDGSFFVGDLERVLIKIVVDYTLVTHYTLFIHSSVKMLYYPSKNEIEII